ncbi:MAG: hypothetical protein LPD71_04940 [Shewanella sp.]|nr:hypothetical protein [Shewanella sp.]MCF1430946.1 hypothetical protein [Shewanella sp.]MCF1438110.1 hypothetical protein [Shewanella sp.]MCF1458134.1 hypothetical protein [Shewanella sp.]
MSSLFKQLSLLGILITLTACSTRYPNQTPLDEAFPAVQGTTLSKQRVSLPMHFSGRPVVLLIGYVQDAQFDIDRWLIGLDMTQTRTEVFELPTIAGMLPRMFETRINDGMRAGIPKSLWGGVITIFDDGERVQEFTGNINPNNARVILLDSQGQVRFFYDEGFAVAPLNALRQTLAELSSSGGQ